MGRKRDRLKQLTTSWAGRTWATGRMAASVGGAVVRQSMGAGERPDIGGVLVERMDTMKGLVMKVGQMVSYLEGSLPPDAQRVLRKLQRDAEPMDWETMEGVIHAALGGSVEDLFETFDLEPVAAASIGQVHRAILDGQPVAVKIQYPEIGKTLEIDLGNLGRLGLLANLGTAMDVGSMIIELRDRMVEECDYEREAANQELFRSLWAKDGRVVIPRTIPERSTRTVLTSEWVDGIDMYTFAKERSEQERGDAGALIFEMAFGSIFEHACFNGDPHPGNYLFMEDGRVAFLDYGCVRYFDRTLIENWKRIARSILDGKKGDLADAMEVAGFIDPALSRFDLDAHWEVMLYLYKPFLTPGFRYTHDYVRESYRLFFQDNPNLRHTRFPAEWVFTNRLQWGLNSVLAILEAQADWPGLYRSCVERPTNPVFRPSVLASE